MFIATIIINTTSAQAADSKTHTTLKRSAEPFLPVHFILQAILKNQPQTLQAVKQLQLISSPTLAIKTILHPITRITSPIADQAKQILQTKIFKPINDVIQQSSRRKRDTACLYGYSHNPKACDSTGEIISWFVNPIGAIIRAAKGPQIEDTEPYQRALDRKKERHIVNLQTEIRQLQAERYPAIPVSYNEAYSTPRPTEAPTTFRTWNPKQEFYGKYLLASQIKHQQILKELLNERHRYLTTLLQGRQQAEEEVWRQSRKRRQALPMWKRIMEDSIKAFMGIF